MKYFARWRARRNAPKLSFAEAAELFHLLVVLDVVVDREVLVTVADRATETAPTQTHQDKFRTYRNALRAGQRIKFGTYPAEFRFIAVPRDLAEAVEDALTGATHEDE